jgi:hypothetical protein
MIAKRFGRLAAAAVLLAATTVVTPAQFLAHEPEETYIDRLCAGMETRTHSAATLGPIDCISATHAIEVGFSDSWRQTVDRALAYAYEKNLIPGIILLCRDDDDRCRSASRNVKETFTSYGIAAKIWDCGLASQTLAECKETAIEALR